MIKKLLLSVLCVACCAQSISMNAVGGRWMRRAFSSQSAKILGAVVASVAIGLVGYAYMDQSRENNPEEDPFIGLSDEEEIEYSESSPSKAVYTPLITAVLNFDATEVKKLANKDTVNEKGGNGKTPLMYAVQNYKRSTFGPILSKRPDLALKDNQGKNWAMHAIESELLLRPFTTLLSLDENVDTSDNAGLTPVMYAAQDNNRSKYLIHLLAKGCSINAQDLTGKTALHHALEAQSNRAVATLLEYDGVGINTVDGEGKTPLMKSIVTAQYNIAEQLLGFDTIALQGRDTDGNSALYYAVQMERQNLVTAILKKYLVDSDVNAEMNLAANNGSAQLSTIINDYRNGTGEFAQG